MEPLYRRRGMTLVELLVSTVIMSIVMTAVAAVFIAVQRNYETMTRSKSAIEGSRAAVGYVERQVRLAGYGLDPQYAFDFTVSGALVKDNMGIGTLGTVDVVTDDLAFRYREPNWLKRGGVSGGTLTLGASSLGDKFDVSLGSGQRFIVLCPGGTDWAVYESSAAAASTAGTVAVTQVTAPFPASSAPCLAQNSGAAAAYVTLLVERRVRLRAVGGRPFLVAYRGIRNATGGVIQPDAANTNYDPVAADVEEFQVSYVMNRPGKLAVGSFRSTCCNTQDAPDKAQNDNWVLGDAAGEPLPDPTQTAPSYDKPYDDVTRYNKHPANIRQVRVSLVARSQRQDRSKGYSVPASALENSSRSTPAKDGYLRLPMTTTIRVPNLLSRTAFTPDLRTAGEGNFNGG